MTLSSPTCTREMCEALDAADPLALQREEFYLPEGVVYLDGNSLGARPKAALDRARAVIENEWGRDLIRSWNEHGWFDLPLRLGDLLAPLIGAGPGEVVVTDSTSINLYKALVIAVRAQRTAHPGRRVIVTERDNFPTDVYLAEGVIDLLSDGYELRLVDESLSVSEAVDDDVAVVSLSHVNYRTGTMYDLAATTAYVHERGGFMIWDLAHSAGAVPVDLAGARADAAVGCTYKYLNGGPGSPAFIWLDPRHLATAKQPLNGWWGHARPFAMEDHFEPAPDVRRLLSGTQPITSLAMVECGLDVFGTTAMAAIRAKSLALTDLFIQLVEDRCAGHPLTLITPREHGRRGSHVSFRHPQGYAVMQALIARGVIGDYREPEVLRFGVTPLYLRYVDIWDAVDALADVLESRTWDDPAFTTRHAVT